MRKVVATDIGTVSINDITENEIYVFKAYGDIYKAHRISKDQWAFVALGNGTCYANGCYDSLKKLLEHTVESRHQVFELKDLSELADFINSTESDNNAENI